MIQTADLSTTPGKFIDFWCIANSTGLELFGNRAAEQFRTVTVQLKSKYGASLGWLDQTDMIVVGQDHKIDPELQQQRPFFESTKILWEGSLSSVNWHSVVQPLRLHKLELEDSIWPSVFSEKD